MIENNVELTSVRFNRGC